MHADTPEPPPRRKWHLQRWLFALVAAMLAYGAWTEYAFRSALKQARALRWRVDYTDPVEEIRADWKNAFKKETWLDGVRTVFIWKGEELVQHPDILRRLNPKELEVRGAQTLQELSALKDLTRLEYVMIILGTNLTNVDALKNLTALREIRLLRCNALTNVDALRNLKALKNVFFTECIALSNVDGLMNLSTLRQLELTGCTALANVEALRSLTALESVSLSECTSLTNVDALMNLTTLQYLDLTGCTGLPKEHITALKAALPNTQIDTENASPFSNIPER